GWSSCSASGSSYSCMDSYGFAALPGGFGSSNDYFSYAGDNGYWHSSSEYSVTSPNSTNHPYMFYNNERMGSSASPKESLYSVRCLKN
ncbi:MAG: fibrobacter succinogenes major paralogous domain-containing protein, partial [Fibromonadaceae bacterium]|nr:fibrobacter succinogenes major paralogous domain-containing protein [Fibromonadaceae bacterium]